MADDTKPRYRSLTRVPIKAGSPYAELGHLIGLAAVVTRLVEFIAHGDREDAADLAVLLRDKALNDIEKQTAGDATGEDQETIKQQARAAVLQALIPLIETGDVH